MAAPRFGKYWILLLAAPLSGCMGGSIAQQIASSIVTHIADKQISDAYDAKLLREAQEARYPKAKLKDTPPDEYQIAFLTAGFNQIQPTTEPLPAYRQSEQPSSPAIQVLQPSAPSDTRNPSGETYTFSQSQLVQVEVWSMILGDEKQAILEKASRMGAASLPPETEWQQWQMAAGALDNVATGQNKQPVIFLIPPGFGKVRSGMHTVVEIAGAGELNVARYMASN